MTTSEVLPRRFVVAVAVAFGLWLTLGIALNPFFSDQYAVTNAILAGEAVLALFVTAVAFWRARSVSDWSSDQESQSVNGLKNGTPVAHAPGSPRLWLALALIFAGTLYLHRFEWAQPRFIDDDRMNLAVAQSWESTRSHLFKPFNEHLLVPTRLWAFAAVQLTTPESLPYALLVGIWILFGVAVVQLLLLAWREFGDGAGLLATAGFALTYVHHECLWWFMAAQWLWTLNILLAVWLILDPRKPTTRRANVAAVLAFIGPFTFSIGLVVGPCAAAWIGCRWKTNRGVWWRPIIGTMLGLLASAPLVAAGLWEDDPGRYKVQLKWFALDLWSGLGSTARLVVDYLVFVHAGIPRGIAWNLVPTFYTMIGFPAASWPAVVAAMIFPFVAIIPALVLNARPACWRLAPFVLLVVLNYGIVIPFRSWMDYPQMSNWTARYHLLPHLGLVLFLVGAWATGRRPEQKNSLTLPFVAAGLLFVYQETTHFRWEWPW
jgi:hypothetical protein